MPENPAVLVVLPILKSAEWQSVKIADFNADNELTSPGKLKKRNE